MLSTGEKSILCLYVSLVDDIPVSTLELRIGVGSIYSYEAIKVYIGLEMLREMLTKESLGYG